MRLAEPTPPALPRGTSGIFLCLTLALGGAIQAYVQWRVQRLTAFGLPIDDTYIHLNFARNLMRGLGLVYNPGQPVAGTTSPGWVLFLAASAIREQWLVRMAVVWSSFFYAATACMAWWMGRRLGLRPMAAGMGAILVLLNGRMIWAGASGMEIPAAACATLAAVYLHVGDREHGQGMQPLTALLLGIASTLRPEVYLLFALCAADHVLAFDPATKQFRIDWRKVLSRRALGAYGVFALCITPYILFCLFTNGHPFPNTYYAKMNPAFHIPPLSYLRRIALAHTDDFTGVFFLFLPVGIVAQMMAAYGNGAFEARLRHARMLWLWPIIFAFWNTLSNPSNLPHMERYITPLLPFSIVLASIGMHTVMTAANTIYRHSLGIFASFLSISLFCLGILNIHRWAGATAITVENINEQQVKMGRWLHDHTPRQSVIALHDAGAIAFYSQRRVIDFLGLVSTDCMRMIEEVTAKGESAIAAPEIAAHVIEQRPDYLVSFPQWQAITQAQPDVFTPMFSASVKVNAISGGDKLVCWKADWSRYKDSASPK